MSLSKQDIRNLAEDMAEILDNIERLLNLNDEIMFEQEEELYDEIERLRGIQEVLALED